MFIFIRLSLFTKGRYKRISFRVALKQKIDHETTFLLDSKNEFHICDPLIKKLEDENGHCVAWKAPSKFLKFSPKLFILLFFGSLKFEARMTNGPTSSFRFRHLGFRLNEKNVPRYVFAEKMCHCN